MNKRVKIVLLLLIVGALFITTNITYSKYVFIRNFDATVSSQPFYFEAIPESDNIVFPRTPDESDTDIILTTTTSFNIDIKNNDDTNFNPFDTTYTISIVDNPKFTFAEGDTITKTIKGGEIIQDTIPLTLEIVDLENPSTDVKIRITSTSPYAKTIDLDYKVIQEGAIQTIEDLLDLSLAVRDSLKGRNTRTSVDVTTQRFKMTRDLDFDDVNSFEDPYRTDYGDINLNGFAAKDLITEINSDTGFLPIGLKEHRFKGVFNGGDYSLADLQIHKALQVNIGLFGDVENATIKNLHLVRAHVTNENQTAGIIVGKASGGVYENLTTDEASSVQSNDTEKTKEDTYTGGIIGYVELNATIKNCTNYAAVTTKFTGDATSYSGPAGGITAWMANSTIEDCNNYGTIVGQSYVGGIAGFAGMQDTLDTDGNGMIRNCHNYGSVSTYVTSTNGGAQIGGIAGYNKATGTVTSCTNHGSVHGRTNVGGIIGNNPGTITNCTNYNSDIVGSTSNVGRIVGSGKTGTGNSDKS